MTGKILKIKTFNPPADARGENGPDFVGVIRKGELRGIIKINEDLCEACDTCRKVCPVGAIEGKLGAKHKINDQRCLTCGQCLISCPFNAIEQMSFVDEVEKMLADKSNIVVAHPSPGSQDSVLGARQARPRIRTRLAPPAASLHVLLPGVGAQLRNLPRRLHPASVDGQVSDSNGRRSR